MCTDGNIKLEMIQDDIDKSLELVKSGDFNWIKSCPVGFALRRMFPGIKDVSVTPTAINFVDGINEKHYRADVEGRAWICTSFNVGVEFLKPISFELTPIKV